MKSKGRAMTSIRMGTTVAVVSLLAAGAGSVSRAATSSSKAVTISVASLIPGSTPAAQQQFANQVAEFEKANPSIKIKPVEYQWTGPTFAAKLAAGTLPTVFEVPFTDAHRFWGTRHSPNGAEPCAPCRSLQGRCPFD